MSSRRFLPAVAAVICLLGGLSAGASFEVVHAFDPGPAVPYSALIRGTDGNFYGSSGYGGTFDHGTIYRLTPANEVSVVVSLSGRGGTTPGAGPGELFQDSMGTLYGTTHEGGLGIHSVYGTVFKVTPQGQHVLLHSFEGDATQFGTNPVGPLGLDAAGNVYGVTMGGGIQERGTIFKISPAGQFSVLVQFSGTSGPAPGAAPYGGIVADGFGL